MLTRIIYIFPKFHAWLRILLFHVAGTSLSNYDIGRDADPRLIEQVVDVKQETLRFAVQTSDQCTLSATTWSAIRPGNEPSIAIATPFRRAYGPRAQPYEAVARSLVPIYTHIVLVSSRPVVHPSVPLAYLGCRHEIDPLHATLCAVIDKWKGNSEDFQLSLYVL